MQDYEDQINCLKKDISVMLNKINYLEFKYEKYKVFF